MHAVYIKGTPEDNEPMLGKDAFFYSDEQAVTVHKNNETEVTTICVRWEPLGNFSRSDLNWDND